MCRIQCFGKVARIPAEPSVFGGRHGGARLPPYRRDELERPHRFGNIFLALLGILAFPLLASLPPAYVARRLYDAGGVQKNSGSSTIHGVDSERPLSMVTMLKKKRSMRSTRYP